MVEEIVSALTQKARPIFLIVVFGILLPLAGSAISFVFFPEWIWSHEPFHTTIEALGAFIAIMASILLLYFIDDETYAERRIVAYALLAMGILDCMHATVHAGNAFVWLHSTATFIGGTFFALTWIHHVKILNYKYIAATVVVLSTLFGLSSILLPHYLPLMVVDGKFTLAARLLNIGGGLLFYVATIYFIYIYYTKSKPQHLVFATHCMLFGSAGILFEYSQLWDLPWWWWHILRMFAYVILFEFIYLLYREYEAKKLMQSEKFITIAEMVAAFTHEVNSPVGLSITAISQINESSKRMYDHLKDSQIKKSDLINYFDRTIEAGLITESNMHQAAQLIGSFKEITVDQCNEDKREFFINHYISHILFCLKPKLKNTNHKIVVHCDKNYIINSYPGSFSQIIINLINNSLLHAFNEINSGEINILVESIDNNIILKYSDNGIGIQAEYMDQIFDRYFTTKKNTGGSGLGLYVIKDIVNNKLLGKISCSSAPGKGAEFTIMLPNILDHDKMNST